MMHNYATLFDKKYLPRGLVLYQTLLDNSTKNFDLYILAMDRETEQILNRLDLKRTKVIGIDHFEKVMGMEPVRASRTLQEYCWTCASVFCACLYYDLEGDLTYLDSDMAFFSDPEQAFEEIGSRHIAIVPHRLIPEKKHLEINGKFNVSWVSFARASSVAQECLMTWARQCKDWCYYRHEEGKFGDQKYLDAWPEKYGKDLCIIQNPGVGLAPWNLGNYELGFENGKVMVDGVPVVFYHYHEFEEKEGGFNLTNYHLRPSDVYLIYNSYVQRYKEAKERIKEAARVEGIHV